MMLSTMSGHFTTGTRYSPDQIQTFSQHGYNTIGKAFLCSVITEDLKNLVPGKRVLDIGCGTGRWSYVAAQWGAKTVDGFDIQEEMVKLAKKATLGLNTVHVKVGDVVNMPYEDSSFDVALSFFVTCSLSPKAFKKHFEEIYRVLEPGGKAILLIHTDVSHSKLYTKIESDPVTVENNIVDTLNKLPMYPTTHQMIRAFEDASDILMACFAIDEHGKPFCVTNTQQLTDGQPIWRKTDIMTVPNFFYSEQSINEQLHSNGFCIERIENSYTEERRVEYNYTDPVIPAGWECVAYPQSLIYHISKPS